MRLEHISLLVDAEFQTDGNVYKSFVRLLLFERFPFSAYGGFSAKEMCTTNHMTSNFVRDCVYFIR